MGSSQHLASIWFFLCGVCSLLNKPTVPENGTHHTFCVNAFNVFSERDPVPTRARGLIVYFRFFLFIDFVFGDRSPDGADDVLMP